VLSPVPASDFLRLWASSSTPETMKLWLVGIALAEGKSPSDAVAGAE
jgi:hypothetical protein